MASSSSSSSDDATIISGINVTPLVDVTLVLLIVFLVTARLVMAQGIPLEIPQAVKSEAIVQSVLAITIDTKGAISVDDKPISSDAELIAIAKRAHDQNKDVRAVIHAATKSEHGSVIRVIDDLRSAEVTRIAFAVRKKQDGAAGTAGSPAPSPEVVQP